MLSGAFGHSRKISRAARKRPAGFEVGVRGTCDRTRQRGTGQWMWRLTLQSRRVLLLIVLLGVAGGTWFAWRRFSAPQQGPEQLAISIDKQPLVFASHSFDPNA